MAFEGRPARTTMTLREAPVPGMSAARCEGSPARPGSCWTSPAPRPYPALAVELPIRPGGGGGDPGPGWQIGAHSSTELPPIRNEAR